MDIILLNGPSSSGKSSIIKVLQDILETYYLHVGIDTFISLMPEKCNRLGESIENAEGFYWENDEESQTYRIRKGAYGSQVNDAYRTTVKHLADSGLKVIVDEVANGNREIEIWRSLLSSHQCFYVGIMCTDAVLVQRERERGDRKMGSALEQMKRVHTGVQYDLVVDSTTSSPEDCALMIAEAINALTIKQRSLKIS